MAHFINQIKYTKTEKHFQMHHREYTESAVEIKCTTTFQPEYIFPQVYDYSYSRLFCYCRWMAKLLRFRSLLFPHPSKPSYSSLSDDATTITNRALYFLGGCKSSFHLFQIQSHLITSGLLQESSFAGRLLKLSSNIISDSGYTLLIFRCIRCPDAFCVNTVIKSYSCSNYYKKAVVFYVEMLRGGQFYPNGFTFPPLISACGKLGCLKLGQMCHGHAVKLGVDNVLPVQNSLIHFYACCELVDVACKVFDKMPERGIVSWNTILDGFAKVCEMGVAHDLFKAMPVKVYSVLRLI